MAWFLGVVVLIAAELVVLVEVARAIGVLPAVLILVLVSASGPWLVRRAGLGVWRRARDRVASGQPPGTEVLDGATLLVGGVLVCIPGFITDVIGLALLARPVRALARRLVLHHFTRRVRTGRRRDRRAEVVDVDSHLDRGGPGVGGPFDGPHGQPGGRPLEPPR
jgi:UPF0716 protein FxsA